LLAVRIPAVLAHSVRSEPRSLRTALAPNRARSEPRSLRTALLSCDQVCSDLQWLLSLEVGVLVRRSETPFDGRSREQRHEAAADDDPRPEGCRYTSSRWSSRTNASPSSRATGIVHGRTLPRSGVSNASRLPKSMSRAGAITSSRSGAIASVRFVVRCID